VEGSDASGSNPAMNPFRLNSLLTLAAMVCISEFARAPKDSDPGPWATAGLGVVLIRRAILADPQPLTVILSGLFLTAAAVASNHGFVNSRNPMWLVSVLSAGVLYVFWEKIEKLWRREGGTPPPAG